MASKSQLRYRIHSLTHTMSADAQRVVDEQTYANKPRVGNTCDHEDCDDWCVQYSQEINHWHAIDKWRQARDRLFPKADKTLLPQKNAHNWRVVSTRFGKHLSHSVLFLTMVRDDTPDDGVVIEAYETFNLCKSESEVLKCRLVGDVIHERLCDGWRVNNASRLIGEYTLDKPHYHGPQVHPTYAEDQARLLAVLQAHNTAD